MSMDVLKIWERIINQVKLIQAFQLGTRRHSRKHLCGQGNGSQALDREKKKRCSWSDGNKKQPVAELANT